MANATDICGCCEGTQSITPQPLANRPGLAALSYRVGTHSAFLETMQARLSSLNPLRGLTTRAPDDPSIALLDAWATVADVLTFYQERIANEGYLRTATERRSVLELARLVDYALRPGVAASAWLALELDKDYEITIQPNELKAQSVPGQGEMPQTFENIELLEARHAWNKLQPRLTQPQMMDTIKRQKRIYVKGISTNLKPNDVVLIEPGNNVYRVAEVKPDPLNDRTLVTFQEPPQAAKLQIATFDLSGIARVAERYATAELLEEFQVSTDTDMAKRVIELLNKLRACTGVSYRTAAAAELDVRKLLDQINVEKNTAVDRGYEHLAPWLTAMIEELNEAAQSVRVAAAREKARAFAEALSSSSSIIGFTPARDPLKSAMAGLTKLPSVPPRNALSLERDIARLFGLEPLEPPTGLRVRGVKAEITLPQSTADIGLQLTGTFDAGLRNTLPVTLANVRVTPDSDVHVYVFRAMARPFGYNAPQRTLVREGVKGKYTSYYEWKLDDPTGANDPDPDDSIEVARNSTEAGSEKTQHAENTLYLDSEYKIQASGWVLVEGPDIQGERVFLNLSQGDAKASQQSLAAYGISGKSTCLDLYKEKTWLSDHSTFTPVRTTVVYCESEELPLADEPIEAPICGGDQEIELDGLYSGLRSGRWVIVSGERDDIVDETNKKVRGVKAAELVMLAEVTQTVKELPAAGYYYGYGSTGLPGDQTHTFIKLARKLEYCYRRDTITLYGNVVKATHGEMRKETLGGGDASQAFQAFTLKQPPLTFVASPTPAGAESTLKVYVNDVRWHETNSLADLAPTERKFITKTDDDDKTTVIFGNGQRGARLPTGIENIRAQYRSGIGRVGNVRAEQISQLLSKPLGVKGVINPLRASGGADRESRDTARKNAPLTVTALDRLVSVSDYADFARTFAGIGKAVATRITDGKCEWVHVTIAGADDIPIDETSDLYRNLLQASHDYGDPHQPVALQVRELLLLVVSAKVCILADYQWEPVATAVRTRLLDTFSFERRELGQDVLLSEVIAAIQSVPGVVYVDVDAFGGVPEKKTDIREGKPIRRLLTPKEISDEAVTFVQQSLPAKLPQPRVQVNLADFDEGAMRPAQLAYLTPTVADTLVLNQVK
jgi:hypothetical protein